MEIRKVAVIGSGIMGHGIAEVFALAGYNVSLEDSFPEALDKARKSISGSLEKLVKSGKIKSEDVESISRRLVYTGDLKSAVSDADIVVEAVPEVLEIKKKLFGDLEKFCRNDAIIASNTSNIRMSTLSEGTSLGSRTVGMHFFNPPVVMKLVEVIKGDLTDDAVFDATFDLAKKIGKVPIKVYRDSAGFVVNRISAPESLFFCMLLDKNIAKPEEIDTFARGQGLPMGPYELMDYVGIDTVVHSLDYYEKELSPEYGKCKAFKEKAGNGTLGLKTGQGFYRWTNGKAEIPKSNPTDRVELMDILAIEVNEAVKVIEEGISVPDDIETGVRLGMNRPFGPISVAQGLTNAEIKKKLEDIQKLTGSEIFRPARSIMEGKLKEIISVKAPLSSVKKMEAATSAPESTEGKYITVDFPAEKVARFLISNTRNNLINVDVIHELERSLKEIWNKHDINVLIISGKGNVFSAGAELTQFFASGADFMENSRLGERVFKLLSEVPKITIAEMKGYALGGGFELSLACDIRVAAEGTSIGFPETGLGLLPGWGGSQRLAKLIGVSRAMYYILSAERFSEEVAHDIGLVSKVYDKVSIDQETVKLASDLATRISPISAVLSKRLINKGSETSIDDGLEMEAISMGLLYGTEDLKEGISAFIQKRKPEFKGR
ncbi:MAG: 3-hydroxyacyl-CoA dehydrogenase [Thermoplasmatales archaeon B_DKE]|nr:MAG: 3-hydroxyacyl-CoA dehydrogenase [Thermoplasmatales archaeon B_DKE]